MRDFNADFRNLGSPSVFRGTGGAQGAAGPFLTGPGLEPFLSISCGQTVTAQIDSNSPFSFYRTTDLRANQTYKARIAAFVVNTPQTITFLITSTFASYVTVVRNSSTSFVSNSGTLTFKVTANTTGPFQIEVTTQAPGDTGQFTLKMVCEDMSGFLTHAVFIPAVNRIYACRGGNVLEFDSSGNYTGRSLAFAPPYLGESYLAVDANNYLWASYWWDFGLGSHQSSKGFYQIDVTQSSGLVLKKFLPFYPTQGLDYTGDTLDNYTCYLVSSLPWPPSSGPSIGPNYSTPYNVGAAKGDAFYQLNPAWLGTWGPAPVATDWYLQSYTKLGSTPPVIWYALDHAATPSDTALDLSTQPTGRSNVIIHVPMGSRLSLNIPLGVLYSVRAIFGFTGSVTTGATVGFLNNMPGVGPRRFAFGTNGSTSGHILAGMLDSTITSGGGLASHYTGTPVSNLYEIDPTLLGNAAIIHSGGSGDDAFGMPGLNVFWRDPATDDVWMGNGVGLAQLKASSGYAVIGAFIECPGLVTQVNGWFSGEAYGVDLATSNGVFYMVTGTNVIYTVPKATPDNAHVSSFTIASRPGMQPRNIRYCSFNGKLYVPTMSDDAVLEIDPATNLVTNVFTGFDLPWDVVFTSTNAFAVQLGQPGLQQIF